MRAIHRLEIVLPLTLLCAISLNQAYAQSCDWGIYKKGAQVTFEIRT